MRAPLLIAWLCSGGLIPAGDWQGFDQFMDVLTQEGLSLAHGPEADLVFVLGEAPNDPPPEAFAAAVRAGATLVVATESEFANPLLARFDLAVAPSFFYARGLMRLRCFNTQPDCPLITEFAHDRTPELFSQVLALATNRAKVVHGAGETLAWFPTLPGRGAVFMRRVALGRGQVLALGDQSLFINLMLPERDNERFARNLARLAGRGRTAAVYVHGLPWREAMLEDAFPRDPPGAPPPEGMLPALTLHVSDVNRLIGDLQRTFPLDTLNRYIPPVVLTLAALAAAWFLMRLALNTFVAPTRPFRHAAADAGDHVMAARRLAALAPPERARRLRARVRAARSLRGYLRFLDTLRAALRAPPDRSTHNHGDDS